MLGSVGSAGTGLNSVTGTEADAFDGTVSSSGNVTILNLSSLHFVKMEQMA